METTRDMWPETITAELTESNFFLWISLMLPLYVGDFYMHPNLIYTQNSSFDDIYPKAVMIKMNILMPSN